MDTNKRQGENDDTQYPHKKPRGANDTTTNKPSYDAIISLPINTFSIIIMSLNDISEFGIIKYDGTGLSFGCPYGTNNNIRTIKIFNDSIKIIKDIDRHGMVIYGKYPLLPITRQLRYQKNNNDIVLSIDNILPLKVMYSPAEGYSWTLTIPHDIPA